MTKLEEFYLKNQFRKVSENCEEFMASTSTEVEHWLRAFVREVRETAKGYPYDRVWPRPEGWAFDKIVSDYGLEEPKL